MKKLLAAGKIQHYKKGETVWRPEDDSKQLFIVMSGRLKAYTLSDSGDENIYLIYAPGDMFPLIWLTKKAPLPIHHVAVTECEIMVLPISKADEILQSDPQASYEMLQQVVRLMTVYVARLNNLEYKFARERVAYRLLLLGHRFGERQNSTLRLPRFNQQEIANSVNVSRENVSRELKRFERLGLIKYTADNIIIKDIEGLHKQVSPRGEKLFIDDI